MLADLSAERYSWVASGDEANPDATTVQARAEAFLSRLGTLFDDALVLTLPETYTGVTLEFLKTTSYYHIGQVSKPWALGTGTAMEPRVPSFTGHWRVCVWSWQA